VTVTNVGGPVTGVLVATFVGPSADPFLITSNGYTAALAPSATCTTSTVFWPNYDGLGPVMATLPPGQHGASEPLHRFAHEWVLPG
jgi:hypothetical protein